MDDKEAKLAKIIFDFEEDGSKEGTKTFEASGIVAKDLRTDDETEDVSHLDFSILALKSGGKDDAYLTQHAMLFDESARVNICASNGFNYHILLFLTPVALPNVSALDNAKAIMKSIP